MSERFGIADHSPGLPQHAPQNPTAQTVYQPFSSDTSYGSTSSSPSYSSGGYSGGYAAPVNYGPRRKGMIRAVLLAMIFGPFGLFYVSWRSACVLLLVAGAAIMALGGVQGFSSDIVLTPVTFVARTVATVWAVVACIRYNRRALREYEGTSTMDDTSK